MGVGVPSKIFFKVLERYKNTARLIEESYENRGFLSKRRFDQLLAEDGSDIAIYNSLSTRANKRLGLSEGNENSSKEGFSYYLSRTGRSANPGTNKRRKTIKELADPEETAALNRLEKKYFNTATDSDSYTVLNREYDNSGVRSLTQPIDEMEAFEKLDMGNAKFMRLTISRPEKQVFGGVDLNIVKYKDEATQEKLFKLFEEQMLFADGHTLTKPGAALNSNNILKSVYNKGEKFEYLSYNKGRPQSIALGKADRNKILANGIKSDLLESQDFIDNYGELKMYSEKLAAQGDDLGMLSKGQRLVGASGFKSIMSSKIQRDRGLFNYDLMGTLSRSYQKKEGLFEAIDENGKVMSIPALIDHTRKGQARFRNNVRFKRLSDGEIITTENILDKAASKSILDGLRASHLAKTTRGPDGKLLTEAVKDNLELNWHNLTAKEKTHFENLLKNKTLTDTDLVLMGFKRPSYQGNMFSAFDTEHFMKLGDLENTVSVSAANRRLQTLFNRRNPNTMQTLEEEAIKIGKDTSKSLDERKKQITGLFNIVDDTGKLQANLFEGPFGLTRTFGDVTVGHKMSVRDMINGMTKNKILSEDQMKPYVKQLQGMVDSEDFAFVPTSKTGTAQGLKQALKDSTGYMPVPYSSLSKNLKDGGRVNMSIGGLANSRGGIGVDDRLSKVGTLESMLAGVGAGLIDIPKGAFTLGAALLDLGFGTSNAAKVEKYFDELTNLDEKAEATFAGDLTRIMVNLGVPGGFAFKKGTELATKALLHKRNGNYFKLTDPKLQERFKTSLNNKGRLFATLGGAGAAGVSDMIFVGDPEHVGTIGDMFGGPTQLKPNDEKNAAREVANRIKFGLDSSLLIGAIGGTGSSIKSLIRRSNDLQTNNDSIDKFLSYLRPRGKKTQEFFDIERENLGLRRSDINRAEEVSRKLDKHIDAIFPFVKNPFNKLGNDGRREFMQKLNDTLLSGDYKISPETGKTEFGLMDKDKVKEITEMMIKKGGSEKDVKGVMEQFYNIRSGWQLMFDDLGTAMGKDALTEFAPLFGKKFKDYLGSTYEIFRNKSVIPMLNYKPTEQAVKKMIKLFKESASEKGVNLGDEQAEYYVNELLASARPPKAIATKAEKTSGVYFNAPDFFINKTTLADMEMPPKTLPLESLTDDAKKVVDELLGKVEDPLQTILTGTNKLSLVTRRNQLFQTLNKSNQEILEKRAAFIKENPGKEIPAALRGMFRETELEAVNDLGKNIKQIQLDPSRTEEAGIVNPLDGLYAERGVAEAIEETAMIAKDKSTLFQLYQSTLLYPKATSQMAKTILSPITHARNFISAGAFAAANGLIPGLTVSFDDTGRAFKEAYGALQIPGARIDNTRYRELLRLGVVNNNVRLGDLQKLLKDVNFGESFDSNVALRNMMRPLSKAKKWTEDMYTAEDDFWKITTFALERSRLKDTYDKYGVKYTNELLDDEAAKIVKNNVPNYDYVNDFVKDLRQLPFGNFVSFPAEIYRTSFNIMNQSWKEIFTPHTLDDGRIVYPLRNIGLKRMFGFSSTVVGVPYGTVEAFKAIHDVTDEEMSALRRFVPDWSKNSTLVPIRDEDGSLKYIDFSHANAYDTMIRPITTMINGVQKGLEEDQVFKNVFLSMIDATKETASPFVSESIWTEALFDVSPIFGRGGRTSEGRRLWTDETPWGDAFYAGIKHLGATVVPGSLPAMGRMRDALTETVDEYGRSYEFLDEALGVAGMRVVDVDPARSMKFKIADFRTGINNSRREFTGPLLKGGPITPEQVVDQYQKANESLFRVQQKMFKDYYAARTLGVTDRALQNTFQDRVSDKQVQAIRTGRFTPFVPSENIAQAFADNAREIGEPDAFKSALSQIRRLIRNYQKLTLGNTFPIIDNPFRVPVTQNITGPLSQITGTPLDNTSLSQPLTGNQQVATAQRGQQVFGSNDPIFGVG